MPAQITELTFLENLAKRFNIPVPRHLKSDASGADIRESLKSWGGAGMVKPDVLSGKRGKAGAIKRITDYAEAQRALLKLQSVEIGSKLPRTAYLVEFIPADLEIYTAITYDSRTLSPQMTISLEGGMDIEELEDGEKKLSFPINIYQGLDAYQVGARLETLACKKSLISILSRTLVDLCDMFLATGMQMCEVNPWRITPEGKPYACDFKATFDEANFKFKNIGFDLPEYPAASTLFEEDMDAWSKSSHQGQAHVADLMGEGILPILFGGGASTIITETLLQYDGDPMFLSDFGGNPPYERMFGTAKICLDHKLEGASCLLILGGKANNTFIDVTFKAIADALSAYVSENGPIDIPVVVGRGGPRLIQGLISLKDTLEALSLPYIIFGPDTPVTLVAEYAARLAKVKSDTRSAS